MFGYAVFRCALCLALDVVCVDILLLILRGCVHGCFAFLGWLFGMGILVGLC